MLQFGSRTITVDGVTVFSDHADPLQFWYLPAPVSLAHRPPDNRVDFTFIKFKPAAATAGAKGGGFLMFESSLRLPKEIENKIKGELAGMVSGGEPLLTPVQFDEGKVRCIALDLEGAGGTAAQPAPPGAFRVVEAIHGATTPSLGGDNVAAFSLSLSQEGAIIVEKAFELGATPVGVIYDLKYTGLRPALHVEITADYERIYNHFSAGLEGQYAWFRIGIEAGFEKLVQEGAIQIKVIDFTGEDDKQQKEKWALDFFKEKLLADWFEPTLTPGQEKGGAAQPEGLDAVMKRAKDLAGDAAKAAKDAVSGKSDKQPDKPASQPAKAQGQPDSTQTSTPPKPPVQPQPQPQAADIRQAAEMQIVSRSPDPLPAGYGIAHKPAAAGVSETLTVTGPAGATVTVDGQSRPLQGGALALDVAPESTHSVKVAWPPAPAAQATQETFNLFFTFENPEPAPGWGPAHPVYRAYVANNPQPPDARFTGSAAPGKTAPPGGAQALQDWLDRLASPRIVSMTGHASFEGDSSAAKRAYNMSLSQRRLDIARGIVGSRATVSSATPRGQLEAEGAHRQGDQDDRVVRIAGAIDAGKGTPGVTIEARISRPKSQKPPAPPPAPPPQPQPQQPPPPPPPAGQTPPAAQTPAATAPSDSMPAAVSLKIKFLRQEEKKTVKLVYDRTEATQRAYAPQGFIGLLLDELEDKRSHFIEVDLDDPFFRQFQVTVDAPIDFARIGLISVQVAIDYGDPDDRASMKHADMIFDRNNHDRQVFTTFMSPDMATGYNAGIQYHFDGASDWIGERLTYEIPARPTTDRTLVLTPFEMLGFLEIGIFPNRVDKGVVDFTEVLFSYKDPAPGGWSHETTLLVRPDSPPQSLKLRLSNPAANKWAYRLVHHLKDGTTREENEVETAAQALPIDDPFESGLDLEFVPLWSAGQVRTAFVDVHYEDAANSYVRDERLEIAGSQTAPVPLRLSILDRTKKSFRYQVTIVGADNRLIRQPAVDGTDTVIGLSP